MHDGKQKTALVLSAGGLFGAYQVGAWKHLSRFVEPDMAIGASIGSLNAWQIAGGCGDRLEEFWLDPAMASVIRLKSNPGWRHGYFETGPLIEEIRKVYTRSTPQIPYWLVVVEVPAFRTRMIPAAEVTPEYMLASCSIYLFFPSVKIHGRQFTDGGLLGHLPLWAAAEKGATRIIAVDCLGRVKPWWVKSTMSTLHLFGPKRRLPKEVHILRPSRPLGEAKAAMSYDPARIREWMDLGKTDAEREFPLGPFGS